MGDGVMCHECRKYACICGPWYCHIFVEDCEIGSYRFDTKEQAIEAQNKITKSYEWRKEIGLSPTATVDQLPSYDPAMIKEWVDAYDYPDWCCPRCGWDSTSIDCDENAPVEISNRRPRLGGTGAEDWHEKWTCPECRTVFECDNCSY